MVYTSTKHAITGLTKQTALDGRAYDICCTQIDIGNAASPLTDRMEHGRAYSSRTAARCRSHAWIPVHVGRAVVCIANMPLDTNVLFLTIMANRMPFVGRERAR